MDIKSEIEAMEDEAHIKLSVMNSRYERLCRALGDYLQNEGDINTLVRLFADVMGARVLMLPEAIEKMTRVRKVKKATVLQERIAEKMKTKPWAGA